MQRGGDHRLPHHRFAAGTPDRDHHEQFCSLQRAVCATKVRETKLFFLADKLDETAELVLNFDNFADYAEKIKTYRKQRHLTQQELAEQLGVKFVTLRSWEQKKAKPPYKVWRQCKNLFNDSVALL
ncbi:multiprotein-bridging factor 1 family protein [Anaerotruncus sp. DFI.9.16]|uniref:helix-turn-helix domain-containing protein n=1 Tax=Anaerotruncus sp. DFI.9.16 TaxID=2965275 RepID=UPI0035210924